MRSRHGFGFRFGFHPFGIYFYGTRPFPKRSEYIEMLEEYKKDLEEELKEVEKELREVKGESG